MPPCPSSLEPKWLRNEREKKDYSFRLPHGNGFARTFALRTLGCLMVTAFASTLFLRFLTPPIEQ